MKRTSGGPLLRGILAVLVTLGLAGCFAYVPVELERVTVDDRVRARLSEDARDRIAEPLGLPGPTVAGRVIRNAGDTLLVRVPIVASPGGGPVRPGLAQDVALPAPAIRQLELRQLRRGRTVGLALGAAALLGYILYQAIEPGEGRGGPGENPPPVDQSLRPLSAPVF